MRSTLGELEALAGTGLTVLLALHHAGVTGQEAALLQELASAIREEREPSRGATFADGLANQRVLDAVRISGTERRWVRPEDINVGS